MNRRLTNSIRFVMDEFLPPIIRDSRWFMRPFFWFAYRGRNIRQMMDLKKDIYGYTPEQYRQLYSGLDSISRNRETDLNGKCLRAIEADIDVTAKSILDVGCGSGYLVRHLAAQRPGPSYTGLDVVPPARSLGDEIEFIEADIGGLDLGRDAHDIVICCHVLEHLLDYRRVMSDLVQAARSKVIFVVPLQRAYFYTLDEHVNFFMNPVQFAYEVGLDNYRCRVLDGDLYYVGEKT